MLGSLEKKYIIFIDHFFSLSHSIRLFDYWHFHI